MIMARRFYQDALGWGFTLWLIGYALGIALFAFLTPAMLGWFIMSIGTVITLWVLFKKVKGESFNYYLLLAIVWTLIAVVFDYFFLVKVFKPADGYYKLDVYLYYALTFVLPVVVGWRKQPRQLIFFATINCMQKITPFLWFDDQAEEAANFYISVFKMGKIDVSLLNKA